ncbi:hypothetical protein Pma05_60130 [Plantactinospora mayteni]|uniref:Secreted protein n=1 Tax=Plantactinospora mayteni TaxID=566021 RepID=A0ABQ4EXP2_9ACTN|nr:hypothetical protein Pma05_60130 [Plantactinospora mayteni]
MSPGATLSTSGLNAKFRIATVWLAAIAILGAKIAAPAATTASTSNTARTSRRTGGDVLLNTCRTPGKLRSDMGSLLIYPGESARHRGQPTLAVRQHAMSSAMREGPSALRSLPHPCGGPG